MTTITQAITTLPAPPDPASDSPAAFATKAAASVLAQKTMVTELQTWTGQVNAVKGEMATLSTAAFSSATTASTQAGNASTSAGQAATYATNANNSAIAAAGSASTAAGFTTTSFSSLTIGTGSKSIFVQASKQFTVGVWVTVVSTASPSNYMFGQVTSYSGTTLIVSVTSTGGSGTLSSWNISLSGIKGDTGAAGTLSGAVSGNIIGGDFTLSGIILKDTAEVFLDKGTVGTGTVTFDYTAGSCQRLQISGALSLGLSNFAPSGSLSVMQLELVNAGSAAVTFPAVNWVKLDGTFTTSVSTYLSNISRNALQTTGTDFILLWTRDAGTTIYGKIL